MTNEELKALIMGVTDISSEAVTVPEWGGLMVWVRTLTGKERDAYEADLIIHNSKTNKTRLNMQNMRSKLLARCLVSEDGKRLFGDDEVEVLGNRSAAAIQRLFKVAQKLNALTDDDVDELEKNSVSNPDVELISD
jgi:hypothetical protein